jgi:hypothetical protein
MQVRYDHHFARFKPKDSIYLRRLRSCNDYYSFMLLVISPVLLSRPFTQIGEGTEWLLA